MVDLVRIKLGRFISIVLGRIGSNWVFSGRIGLTWVGSGRLSSPVGSTEVKGRLRSSRVGSSRADVRLGRSSFPVGQLWSKVDYGRVEVDSSRGRSNCFRDWFIEIQPRECSFK